MRITNARHLALDEPAPALAQVGVREMVLKAIYAQIDQ
jgi:hypothetical protein